MIAEGGIMTDLVFKVRKELVFKASNKKTGKDYDPRWRQVKSKNAVCPRCRATMIVIGTRDDLYAFCHKCQQYYLPADYMPESRAEIPEEITKMPELLEQGAPSPPPTEPAKPTKESQAEYPEEIKKWLELIKKGAPPPPPPESIAKPVKGVEIPPAGKPGKAAKKTKPSPRIV